MRTFSAEEEDVDGAASLRRLWRRRTRRSLPDEEEEPVESVPSEEEELADGAIARGRGGGGGGGGEGRGCLTKNLTHVFLSSLAEKGARQIGRAHV